MREREKLPSPVVGLRRGRKIVAYRSSAYAWLKRKAWKAFRHASRVALAQEEELLRYRRVTDWDIA